MNRTLRYSAPTFFLTLLLLVISTTFDLSAQDCTITLSSASGPVRSTKAELTTGANLAKDDTLIVPIGSSATLTIGTAGELRISQGSRLYVETSYCQDPATGTVRLKLLTGSYWAQGKTSTQKFELSTENFMVQVGGSTLSINAHYLDTMFTVSKGSARIETRDWSDTVEVETYSFPFKGPASSIYMLTGNSLVLPWGGRGSMLKEGNQSTFGFDQNFISSKPQPIVQSELRYSKDGIYLVGNK